MGVSHLLEHMVFKGTERRSARATRPGARGARRLARRVHRPRPHQLPGPRARSRTCRSRAGRPHRPGPPSAARATPTSSSSGTWCSRRSTASTTRPTIWSSSCTPRRLWPEHPYGYSILGTRETRRRRSAPPTCSELHDGGYHPRQLCDRRGRASSTTSRCSRLLAREGWFDGDGRRAAVVARSGRRRAVRGGAPERMRDTAQTHIVFGADTFPLTRPAALRAGDPHQCVRRRHVEPTLSAGAGGAGAGLRGLRVQAVLSERRRSSASTSGPSRPPPTQAIEAIPRSTHRLARGGTARRRARRREAAAQGSGDAVAGESRGTDESPGRIRRSTATRTARSTRCSRRSMR